MMNIGAEVLKRIKPGAEEIAHIDSVANDLVKAVREYVGSRNLDIEVRLVGSYAKGTFLSDPDLDLFLMFPEGTSRETLERTGLKIGEEVLGGVHMYSEHPYTRGVYKGIDVDMVPSIKIASTAKMQTSVDRTPFHTEYILSRMNEEQRDQVRLLKAFMKGIETYGAEPNTRGFSGYLCELLVLMYGSFENVLKGSAGWKDNITLSLEKRGPPMVDPFVFYDPVDERRNAGSAVHLDTMALFIVASKAYLASPSEKFFFPRDRVPLSKEILNDLSLKHGSRIVTVIFKRPDVIEDNLYSQLWKTRYALTKKLNDFDYNVLRCVQSMKTQTLEIAFEIERDVLSKTYRHSGPPVWVKSAESFLNKWRDNEYGKPFIEDGCWTVISERWYFTAQEMLTDEAAIAGIGREIDPKTMKVRDHETSLRETDPVLLTELMLPMPSWEV